MVNNNVTVFYRPMDGQYEIAQRINEIDVHAALHPSEILARVQNAVVTAMAEKVMEKIGPVLDDALKAVNK